MPRRRQQPRGGRRSPLWARVCVPGLECTGGRAPGAGGFVWDVSIFYKTTTRINHRLRPCRGNNTGMWLSLPKPVSAIVPDDVQCLGRSAEPLARGAGMGSPPCRQLRLFLCRGGLASCQNPSHLSGLAQHRLPTVRINHSLFWAL